MTADTVPRNNFENESKELSGGGRTSHGLENHQSEDTSRMKSRNRNFFNAPERVPFPAPVDGSINTGEFLAAAEDYVKFFYHFGFLFKFAIRDTQKFTEVLREFYEVNKEERKTLENLLVSAKKEERGEVSLYLLWLKRGLEFYYELLQAMYDNVRLPRDQQQGINPICVAAYDSTLRNHHTFIAAKTVKLGMKALPSRETILTTFCDGADADEEALYKDAVAHIRHLPQVVRAIDDLYDRLQLDTSSRA